MKSKHRNYGEVTDGLSQGCFLQFSHYVDVTQIPHHGAITVIKENKGYIFAGGDDGNLSVWRVKDGRQLIVEKFVPGGCINDLDASVSCQKNGAFEATVAVLIDRCVYLVTLSASTDSELVLDWSRCASIQLHQVVINWNSLNCLAFQCLMHLQGFKLV